MGFREGQEMKPNRVGQPVRDSWWQLVLVVASVLFVIFGAAGLARWVECMLAPPLLPETQRGAIVPPSDGLHERATDSDADSDGRGVARCGHVFGIDRSSAESDCDLRRSILDRIVDLGLVRLASNEIVEIWGLPDSSAGELANLAIETSRLTKRMTGLPIPGDRLVVLSCKHLADAQRLVRAVKMGRYPSHALGAFFRRFDIAVVLELPGVGMTFCHEIVHWVIAHSVKDCPPALDEGLARYLSEAIAEKSLLESATKSLEDMGAPWIRISLAAARRREVRLTTLTLSGRSPHLGELCAARARAVYGSGRESFQIWDLAYVLAFVLCELEPETGISARRLMRDMRKSDNPAAELSMACRSAAVESAWARSVSNYEASILIEGR